MFPPILFMFAIGAVYSCLFGGKRRFVSPVVELAEGM